MRYPVFLTLITILLSSCLKSEKYRHCDGITWGTTYHITYKSDKDLNDSIHYLMRQAELSLSPFCDSSIISRINQGKDTQIDTMVNTVFTTSQEINRLSDGAFDPTVAPLVNLWGFGYREMSPPSKNRIDSILNQVGIEKCSIENNRIIKHNANTEFNFSAITKGYGCDIIAYMFKRNNCNDFLIEIGGEIRVSGQNQKGAAWNIAIDTPTDNDSIVTHSKLTAIAISDCGVATSGNYRNFRSTPEGKIHHTINPKNGLPAETSILSVTVISNSCMRADALATACMASPLSKAIDMIEHDTISSALFVVSDSSSDGKWQTFATTRFPSRKLKNP